MCDLTTKDKLDLLFSAITIVVAIFVVIQQLSANRKMQAEVTFFALLNSIRELVSNMEGTIRGEKIDGFEGQSELRKKGEEYFFYVNQELQDRLGTSLGNAAIGGQIDQRKKDSLTEQKLASLSKETYDTFFKTHLAELGHYFRFTYNVIDFVHSHPDITYENKKKYINFIQSQMSDSELQLIFFNGIGEHGGKFHRLIEIYNFLQNVRTDNHIAFVEHLYPKSKFR